MTSTLETKKRKKTVSIAPKGKGTTKTKTTSPSTTKKTKKNSSKKTTSDLFTLKKKKHKVTVVPNPLRPGQFPDQIFITTHGGLYASKNLTADSFSPGQPVGVYKLVEVKRAKVSVSLV